MSKTRQPLRKRLLLCLMTLLMPLSLLAQDIKVQGVVKDETGETVIGARPVATCRRGHYQHAECHAARSWLQGCHVDKVTELG